MNQILFINDKKGNGTNIKNIIRFFAIILIIFGLAILGQGSYAIMQKNKEKNAIPDLSVQNLNDGNISIIVVHNKEIDSIIYSWNDGEQKEIGGVGRKEIEEKILAKSGTNNLKVTAIDIEGKTNVFEGQFTIEDKIKPELYLNVIDNKIEINAIDETQIAYITYRWNEEEEVKIEAEDGSEIIEEIDIKEGTNTLTVVAVDENNNMQEKKQEFRGLSKPKITSRNEEGQLVLVITHEQGIRKIKLKFNDQELVYNDDITKNEKEITLNINLAQGDNKIDVWAYGTEDIEEIAPGEFLNQTVSYNP